MGTRPTRTRPSRGRARRPDRPPSSRRPAAARHQPAPRSGGVVVTLSGLTITGGTSPPTGSVAPGIIAGRRRTPSPSLQLRDHGTNYSTAARRRGHQLYEWRAAHHRRQHDLEQPRRPAPLRAKAAASTPRATAPTWATSSSPTSTFSGTQAAALGRREPAAASGSRHRRPRTCSPSTDRRHHQPGRGRPRRSDREVDRRAQRLAPQPHRREYRQYRRHRGRLPDRRRRAPSNQPRLVGLQCPPRTPRARPPPTERTPRRRRRTGSSSGTWPFRPRSTSPRAHPCPRTCSG